METSIVLNEECEHDRYYSLERTCSLMAKYQGVMVNVVFDCCREQLDEGPTRSLGTSSVKPKETQDKK